MSSDPLTIAVIEGSTREKRLSIHATRFVANIGAAQEGVEIILVDPRDFSFPNDGNDTEGKDSRFTEITAKADGFFIVTPEYNHSFPGSLKRMLDSEYENYFHKPVALAGVSNGSWGGTRVVESLLPVMRSLMLVTLEPAMYFPRVQDIFDEDGIINPEVTKKYVDQTTYLWSELLWMTRTLKYGREHFRSPS